MLPEKLSRYALPALLGLASIGAGIIWGGPGGEDPQSKKTVVQASSTPNPEAQRAVRELIPKPGLLLSAEHLKDVFGTDGIINWYTASFERAIFVGAGVGVEGYVVISLLTSKPIPTTQNRNYPKPKRF